MWLAPKLVGHTPVIKVVRAGAQTGAFDQQRVKRMLRVAN
jgi:hypothetical protein